MRNNSLLVHEEPKSPLSEAYRVLRTNIQFSNFDMPIKVLAVTSSSPGEGKSTTVSNLAITFAQAGNKVLLIDGDLRKPAIHKIYGLTNNAGLVNILVQQEPIENYIRETIVENLFVITSGPIPPNPSELLQSENMRKFLDTVEDAFDMVLIDTPPVCNVADAAILSSFIGGIILVAASGKVKIDSLKRAKEILDKVNANIIGVVLNKLDKSANKPYYDYYYNYYEDGKTKGKKVKKEA